MYYNWDKIIDTSLHVKACYRLEDIDLPECPVFIELYIYNDLSFRSEPWIDSTFALDMPLKVWNQITADLNELLDKEGNNA